MTKWTEKEIIFLKENYPNKGLKWTAKKLQRSACQIRSKVSRLGIIQNRDSDFFKDWQKRAANSKIGKKRPQQAAVILKSHAEGKLKITAYQRKEMSIRTKKRIAENGHPKGMLGKKHSIENRQKFSEIHKKRWENMTDKQIMEKNKKMMHTRHIKGNYANYRVTCTWKAAWREFGGKRHFYRSRWEANYGRYLEFLKTQGQIKEWLHEPDVFWFEGIKRGCVSYLPDFKIINNDDSIEYHEVKGWMDNRSKTKISRMAKYHPDVILIVIESKQYKEIFRKLANLIPDWE